MGNRYTVTRDPFTGVANQDALTLISGAGRRIRVVEARAIGEGATSAPQRIFVARSAAGTTPTGAIVPSKADHAEQPAANFTTATAWAAQPTPETNGVLIGWNSLGAAPPLVAPKGTILEARNGECISFRIPAGTTPQQQGLSVVVEED